MPRALALPLAVLTGWAVIAAVFAIASSLTLMLAYQPPQWERSIATAIAEWSPWAAFTPLVMWLARRNRLSRRRWWRSVLILAPAGLVIVFFKLTFTRALQSAGGTGDYIAITNVATQFFIYCGIVSGTHVLENYREGRARELAAAQLETALSDARLQLLKMQLQPHFLFNTLNTISALMHRDVEAADAMIARLSDLLRISLQTVGVQEVTLKEELDFLAKYLEIEQTRFRDRLKVVFDVAPDTFDALVPNLVLQPLVENAIKHGIGPRPAPGTITICSRRVGAILELVVQDNGVGLSAARLSDFNRGIGLSNTRSRLDHLYGSSHRFEFRQPAEGGLQVLMAIPLVDVGDDSVGVPAVEGAA